MDGHAPQFDVEDFALESPSEALLHHGFGEALHTALGGFVEKMVGVETPFALERALDREVHAGFIK